MGLLVGPRRHHHVIHVVIMAVVVEAVVVPGLEDDFQGLGEPLAALVEGDAIALIRAGEAAAANAKVQPAPGDVIHGGGFFGQADGVGQGQHADAGAHADALGAGGDDAGHHQRDRRHRRDAGSARVGGRARGGEVTLGQPDAVDARLVSQAGPR